MLKQLLLLIFFIIISLFAKTQEVISKLEVKANKVECDQFNNIYLSNFN